MIKCACCEWEVTLNEAISLILERKTYCIECAENIISFVPDEWEHGFY
jgi:hypothetical protein